MINNIFKTIIQEKTKQPIKKMENGTENNNLVELAKDGSSYQTVQKRVPANMMQKTTINVVLDYTAGGVNDEQCSIIIGDSSGMMRAKNNQLQIINPKLKITGFYNGQTFDIMNLFALGNMIRLKRLQGSANLDNFWTNKTPVTQLMGQFGQQPSAVVIDFQQDISPSDLNLKVRNKKDFSFDVSVLTALQLLINSGELVSYTFDVYQVGVGQLMEMV